MLSVRLQAVLPRPARLLLGPGRRRQGGGDGGVGGAAGRGEHRHLPHRTLLQATVTDIHPIYLTDWREERRLENMLA